MNKIGEIVIKSANVIKSEIIDRTRLVYSIENNKQCYELYYEVDNEYAQYLCSEIADGVVISILSYAMRGGYDIISDIPISEELYYQINEQLIPQFVAASKDVYRTQLISSVVCSKYNPRETAMAMSCGVDSLTSFYQSTRSNELSAYKVSMLTFFENGAHHLGTIGHDERENEVFEAQLVHVQKFCEKINFPLLVVRSNLDKVLSELFWKDSYQSTHSFRNAGFVLLFQKLINKYYYGATYDISQFNGSLNCGDCAHFDSFLFPNVSTKCTMIYVTASTLSRIEKLQYLKQFPEVHESILVCYNGGDNCGKCYKCMRTLVELDFAGLLNTFQESFDIQDYKLHRNEYLFQIYKKRKRNHLYNDICKYAKSHKIDIPISIRFLGSFIEAIAIVIEKVNNVISSVSCLFERKENEVR